MINRGILSFLDHKNTLCIELDVLISVKLNHFISQKTLNICVSLPGSFQKEKIISMAWVWGQKLKDHFMNLQGYSNLISFLLCFIESIPQNIHAKMQRVEKDICTQHL